MYELCSWDCVPLRSSRTPGLSKRLYAWVVFCIAARGTGSGAAPARAAATAAAGSIKQEQDLRPKRKTKVKLTMCHIAEVAALHGVCWRLLLLVGPLRALFIADLWFARLPQHLLTWPIYALMTRWPYNSVAAGCDMT